MDIPFQGDVPYPFGALFTFEDPFVVAARGTDGRILHANERLRRHYGCMDLIGRRDADFLAPEAAAALARLDLQCIDTGKPVVGEDDLRIGAASFRVASVRIPHRSMDGEDVVLYAAIPTTGSESESVRKARAAVARLEEEVARVERAATTDVLTGAYSRTWIDDQGRNELIRLSRYGHPVSIIFMDMDGLKTTNDLVGHAAGDDLLRRFTAVIRSYARGADRLGRYGGDEFVLLMPNTSLHSAVNAARRFQSALRAQPEDGRPRMAACFGVVEARAREDWASLLARADAAMYRAKRQRSNEVEVELNTPEDTIDGAEAPDRAFVQLRWSGRYDSGEPSIDTQHQGLFRLGNALLAAQANGRPRDEIEELVRALVVDVRDHFAAEERLLNESGYRFAREHAETHRRLLETADRLSDDFLGGGHDTRELIDFLVFELIARHLLRADREFFSHLAQRRGGD